MYASLFYCGGSVTGEARPEPSVGHLKDASEWELGSYGSVFHTFGLENKLHVDACHVIWVVAQPAEGSCMTHLLLEIGTKIILLVGQLRSKSREDFACKK